ncbi:MAG: Rpn family recombination-promoting nuclease/putative transposase [Spirochaetaceae bacterium]|nr:Rpn family recombination-promoting nuclease/putative transposase [Spirochaetaceae bacterium]
MTDKAKRDKINEIIGKEEGIKMANDVLITISRDEVERARLLSEYKYEVDRQNDLISARREGLAQGISQGLAQGISQGVAQGQNYVLSLLEQGCSLEEIKRRLK